MVRPKSLMAGSRSLSAAMAPRSRPPDQFTTTGSGAGGEWAARANGMSLGADHGGELELGEEEGKPVVIASRKWPGLEQKLMRERRRRLGAGEFLGAFCPFRCLQGDRGSR